MSSTVWRPRRARAVAYVMATAVMVLMIGLAVLVQGTFKLPDRIGLVVFGGLVAGLLVVIARAKAVAGPEGLTVVNPLRTHRFEWAQIVGVTFPPGAPWPYLDLADGRNVGVMGIQGSEGASAREAVEELKVLLERYGEGQEPTQDR
ncbi:PH domain-containing protein [Actinocorallia longicatena]|uniref:PH domain-containing protein n=1 Tax=Actinocorallia longicatena TaxID=111803 RepID=A0ABP6QEF4_9ACTN